jgi:hypothetical protein
LGTSDKRKKVIRDRQLQQKSTTSVRQCLLIPLSDRAADALRTEILNSPVKWTQLYIPGHQEDPMDQPALLNTEMDIKCKQHWQDTTTEQQCGFK